MFVSMAVGIYLRGGKSFDVALADIHTLTTRRDEVMTTGEALPNYPTSFLLSL